MSQIIPGPSGFTEVIGGNTAGATVSISSGTLSLVAGSNLTLSQNGNSLTLNGPATPLLASLDCGPVKGGVAFGGDVISNSLLFHPFIVPVQINAVRMESMFAQNNPSPNISIKNNEVYSFTETYLRNYAVYTQGTGANSNRIESYTSSNWSVVISYAVDASTTATNAASGSVSMSFSFITSIGANGAAVYGTSSRSFTSSSTNTSTFTIGNIIGSEMQTGRVVNAPLLATFVPANYWMGFLASHSTSSSGTGANTYSYLRSGVALMCQSVTLAGQVIARLGSVSAQTVSSSQYYMGRGTYSVTTAAFPGTISFSEISATYASLLVYPFNLHSTPYSP